MNGPNDHVLRSHGLDGVELGRDGLPVGAWRWIVVGQAWMLAAFTGMSLVVIAALSAFHGEAGHGGAMLLATGCAGALLVLLSWQGVSRMLQRVEREEPRGPGPGVRQAVRSRVSTSPPAQARMARIAPSW